MSKVKINYQKVYSSTKTIQNEAQENLRKYAQKEYKQLKDAIRNCKGDYIAELVKELDDEQKAVIAASDFIIKLQKMIKNTSDSFQNLDKSYKNGVKIQEK